MIPLRRRQHGQPAVAGPAQRWIARGLVYADLLTTYPANAITGQPDTITGTKVVTAPWGLARGFGSTVGAGTTDKVQTSLTTHPALRTYLLRCRRDGAGGSGLGRYFASNTNHHVFGGGSGATIDYQRPWSASSGGLAAWNIAAPAAGVSFVLAIAYDASSTANAPKMYLDGASKTVSTSQAAAGTLTALSDAFFIGNRSSDNLRNFDGLLSDFYVFDSILSDGEIAELTDPSRVWEDQRIWVPVSAGGGSVSLAVANAAHAHAADNLALTTSSTLAIQDATHGHAADSLGLTTASALTVADATHAHSADGLALNTSAALAVVDATHAHAADSLALNSAAFLTVADATHGHAADSLLLSATGSASLTVNDATHAHAADAFALSTASFLVTQDAGHQHTGESITLSTGAVAELVIAASTHAHAADSVSLVTGSLLTIDDAIHAQNAGNIGFTAESWLVVQDATHAHFAGELALDAASGSGASAAQVWNYVLGNGLSAGVTLSAVHRLLLELHQIHGLQSGAPLSVTPTSRAAAAITQTIVQVADTVIVNRV